VKEVLLVVAVVGLVVGVFTLGWSVREIYLSRRNYTPPKRKRRSTYVGR
jgi:hypothetical protein